MRRALLTLLLTAFLAPGVRAGEAPRWVAYLETGRSGGSVLRAILSDGTGGRVLLRSGVRAATAGPDGVVALLDEDPPRLVLIDPATGESTPIDAGSPASEIRSVVAAPDGRLAIARVTPSGAAPPPHIAEVLDELLASRSVLLPPIRPPGTIGTVARGGGGELELIFTNDPEGELSHAEQVNVSIRAGPAPGPTFPDATAVPVRGTEGRFTCGAAACFLSWDEDGTAYTVGEFGDPASAAEFAATLVPPEVLLGPAWRESEDGRSESIELVARAPDGTEETIERMQIGDGDDLVPLDWDGAGERLLVLMVHGDRYELNEYGAEAGATTISPGSTVRIADAAYGLHPQIFTLVDLGQPAMTIQTRLGNGAGEAIAIDNAGDLLARVAPNGDLVVRDLETGRERTIARNAIDVTIAPDAIRSPAADPAPGPDASGAPIGLVAAVAAGGTLLSVGAIAVVRGRRRPGGRRG